MDQQLTSLVSNFVENIAALYKAEPVAPRPPVADPAVQPAPLGASFIADALPAERYKIQYTDGSAVHARSQRMLCALINEHCGGDVCTLHTIKSALRGSAAPTFQRRLRSMGVVGIVRL